MPRDFSRLEMLLKQLAVPSPSPDFAARIITAARATPQRVYVPLERIVPSVFHDVGIPAPLLTCASIVVCGFFVGLTSPLAHDMTDVLASFGGFVL